MAKLLDLTMFQDETFDIKFTENDILHVKKPTEELAIKILAHVNTKNDDIEPEKALAIMRDMVKSILNHNKDGKDYTDEWIKNNLPVNMQIAIINGYSKFMMELENNPN